MRKKRNQPRRPDTTRVVAYLDVPAMEALNHIIATTYDPMESYGAISHTISNAISYYYENITINKTENATEEGVCE